MVHHHDAVAQPLGLLDVVGDEDDGGPGVADVAHDVPGVAPRHRVEVLGQLVEEHDLRPADEGEGDEQPLPLAARQGVERASQDVAELPLLDELARRARRRVQRGEQRQRLGHAHALGQGGVLQLGADAPAQLVAGLRRVEAEHAHRARVGAAQTLEDLDGRRLAGAVRAEQAEQLAALDGEVDAADDLGVAVALDEAVDLDDG